MHKTGLQRPDEVEWAILEADGEIAIVPVEDRGQKGSAVHKGAKEHKQI